VVFGRPVEGGINTLRKASEVVRASCTYSRVAFTAVGNAFGCLAVSSVSLEPVRSWHRAGHG
jgi:hypothetical protein